MLRGCAFFALVAFLVFPVRLHAQAGVAPKVLFDPAAPNAAGQVEIEKASAQQVSTSLSKDGLSARIKGGTTDYPGVLLKPEGGTPWNLGLYGHVEAKVTNTGTSRVNLNMRVDNEGDWTKEPWNCESQSIEPGKTRSIRVYFGYSYGGRPGFKLKPEAVSQVLFFTGKVSEDVAFRIERLQAAGWVGEKVGMDPERVAKKPANGILLDDNTVIRPGDQIVATGGAKGTVGADGKSLRVDFAGGKDESVTFKPAEGLWNLNEYVEVKLRLRNVGQTAITPSVRVASDAGSTDLVTADAPLAAGAEAEIIIPFAARVPWKGLVAAAQLEATKKGTWGAVPGTGTEYRSNRTTGITLLSGEATGATSLLVTAIVADCPPLVLPEWLGKKPPVDGEWVQTLNEEFDGKTIDLHRWNVHASNWWDKRMHFSKDQVIVGDGLLKLRLEKKPGYHNDDPKSGAKTDYAAGQVDTFGKWTQRYGYFEIREKQPTAKCLWPGFWMMPDRGLKHGGNRGETGNGGMEFDITESQSAWGIHRFNIACHWDNYGNEHKSIGASSNYVQADKDGFIVVGLLWTPGSYVVYGNGREIFRWDSPRISSQQAHLILQNEIGGWDNEEVDDAQLPSDYAVDYIRIWQRKDLVSAEDGPKPNKGDFDAFHEELPAAATAPAK